MRLLAYGLGYQARSVGYTARLIGTFRALGLRGGLAYVTGRMAIQRGTPFQGV